MIITIGFSGFKNVLIIHEGAAYQVSRKRHVDKIVEPRKLLLFLTLVKLFAIHVQFFKTCNNGMLCSLLLISKHERYFLKQPMLVKDQGITYKRAYTLILFKFIPKR